MSESPMCMLFPTRQSLQTKLDDPARSDMQSQADQASPAEAGMLQSHKVDRASSGMLCACKPWQAMLPAGRSLNPHLLNAGACKCGILSFRKGFCTLQACHCFMTPCDELLCEPTAASACRPRQTRQPGNWPSCAKRWRSRTPACRLCKCSCRSGSALCRWAGFSGSTVTESVVCWAVPVLR